MYGTILNNSGSAETPAVSIGIGATTAVSSFPSAGLTSQTTPRGWRLQCRVTVQATNAERLYCEFGYGAQGTGSTWPTVLANQVMARVVDVAEDLTAGKDLFVRIQFTVANANLRIDRASYILAKFT
jgi:hypothetical protein